MAAISLVINMEEFYCIERAVLLVSAPIPQLLEALQKDTYGWSGPVVSHAKVGSRGLLIKRPRAADFRQNWEKALKSSCVLDL